MRYTVTGPAKRDIRGIVDYIRRDNVQASIKVGRKIREAIQKIAAFPNLGHTHNELKTSSVRAYGIYSYLILYKLDAKHVTILRVIHGARDLKRVFRKG